MRDRLNPKFSASLRDDEVTMFHATRPSVIRSRVANLRARSNGFSYVVDAVTAKPRFCVTEAIADTSSIGSMIGMPMASRSVMSVEPRYTSITPCASAMNRPSNRPRSRVRAVSIQ
ncbi:hypothetical protein SAMN05443637_10853 [Pseudonocardia thermophila]|uniref:Uncharacterized protein n=1 Tax=Pseudonocardia thermophila TaxID=1848 RepID=A0A1M6THT7_PSETH|nr:hypothetical protein SAMN05443637_10853 [Pseudonocardia thermophila]